MNESFIFKASRIEDYENGHMTTSGSVNLQIKTTIKQGFIQIELQGLNKVVLPQKFELPISTNPMDLDEIEDRIVYGRLQPFYSDRSSRIPVVMEIFKNKPCIRFALPSLELIEYYGSYE